METKSKFGQALELIEKTAEEWDTYAIYNLIKDAKVPIQTSCPNISTYEQLLKGILKIYEVDEL